MPHTLENRDVEGGRRLLPTMPAVRSSAVAKPAVTTLPNEYATESAHRPPATSYAAFRRRRLRALLEAGALFVAGIRMIKDIIIRITGQPMTAAPTALAIPEPRPALAALGHTRLALAALGDMRPTLLVPDAKTTERFLGFFTAHVHNPNTRRAHTNTSVSAYCRPASRSLNILRVLQLCRYE
jgi:hypothetical protein